MIILNDEIDVEACLRYKLLLEEILNERIQRKNFIGHKESIVLHNYLRDSLILEECICPPTINVLLNTLLDENYTLTNMVARNRTLSYSDSIDIGNDMQQQIGYGWHVDARKGSYGMPSINTSYITMLFLEDLNEETSNTLYIPKSHKRKQVKISEISKNEYQEIRGRAGTIAIMDANLIHTGSIAKSKSRWTIFNLFSHWHVKPYFDFPAMFEKSAHHLSVQTRKLLHFNSTPPLNENDRINTLK